MSKPLENRLALVTGSSRGIGAAIARRLAEHGATVLVHYAASPDRAEAVVNEIRQAGGEAEAIGADLAKHEGPATLIAHLDAAFGGKYAGRLDVLVNNAGTAEIGSLAEATDEQFDKQFNLNVRAVFQLSREAARRMTKAGWGRIINIGSNVGEQNPMASLSLYSATKFAVRGLTRGWSRDLGATGVTVNNVQPGPVETDLNPAAGEFADTLRARTSVGRYGQPEEVAAAVAFLAGPEAGFINGESLTIDGGTNA